METIHAPYSRQSNLHSYRVDGTLYPLVLLINSYGGINLGGCEFFFFFGELLLCAFPGEDCETFTCYSCDKKISWAIAVLFIYLRSPTLFGAFLSWQTYNYRLYYGSPFGQGFPPNFALRFLVFIILL